MNASEIKTATTAELVAYYNAHSGAKQIKKFQDRATAEQRIAILISAAEEEAAVVFGDGNKIAVPEGVNNLMKHVSKTLKAAGATPATPPRKAGLPGPNSKNAGKRLFKKVTTNPRRPGSAGHTSFSVIRDGMSYEEYRLKGGRSNDLAWDIKHGYVEVK